jgi:cytosine/adenosine deaminase-related metal-dependent hydrolase
MLLCNINIPGEPGLKNLCITGGKIESVSLTEKTIKPEGNKAMLMFEDAIAFPGLINSHDHLDFNLFPSLRNSMYNNYTEWGRDIHEKNKNEINKALQVPQHLRVQWGIYKNLLNGFTTVVNHGKRLKIEDELIHVFQKTNSLHSIGFEKNWKWKLNSPLKNKWPFAIHVGEGKDNFCHKEISRLIKWNLFKKNIIGIHGVAMAENQASHFRALVWCPVSNYFLLNKTAAVGILKSKTKIIFGSDSTLTSDWDMWEHIRLARNEKMLTDAELFKALTTEPAAVWGLHDTGKIRESYQADIVIANKKNGSGYFDNFFSLNAEDILLIMHKGHVRLFDERLKKQLAGINFPTDHFSKVNMNEAIKYVQGDLPGLMKNIKEYYPEADFRFHCTNSITA